MIKKNLVFIILLLLGINNAFALGEYKQIVNQKEGIYLDYHDLVELSKMPKPQGELLERLEKQLNVPIVEQSPEVQTKLLHGNILGDFFRVASWNIERGFNVNKIEKIFMSKNLPWQVSKNDLQQEIDILSNASVIILNEVDVGLPRTNYENIAQRLANALKMGYIFGTEFVEVDPYQLGVKKFTKEEKIYLEEQALKQIENIEKDKFLGLHGTAILTKHPILNAKIIRLPDCYNWYEEEVEKISALELVRRETAEKIFSAKVLTELRHGGRMALIVDLLLPNGQKFVIVATHLENRCLPDCRVKQFEFLLNRLRNIKSPLILAGDFNTSGTDVSPTSVKKEILKRVKNPEFIATQAILSLTPFTLAQNVIFNVANKFRQLKDPTIRNIPIILSNKEREIFDYLKDFRFNDGGAFDVRGVPEKTHRAYYGLLSNSNQRDIKGFTSTFELERHFGIAKYKLDWIFVKPLNLKESNGKEDSYAYAPHFGRTLQLVNRAFGKEKISDHDPITVDIPVEESLR